MQEPAVPGSDPDAEHDVIRTAHASEARHVDHAAGVEGQPRRMNEAGSVDEENLNDAWLVELARRGDHQAFAVLVRRYERKLIRVLTRLVREPEQARDLAQETFWRIHVRLDRFDTSRRFGPWLFRVGINLGLDWLRSQKNEQPPASSIDRAGGDGSTKTRARGRRSSNSSRHRARSSVYSCLDARIAPHDPGTARSGRFFIVGGCGHCGPARVNREMAPVQGPRKIP